MIIEKYVLKILRLKNIKILYSNKIFIHKNIPWISSTPDGVIVEDKRIVSFLEIKSYTSSPFKNNVLMNECRSNFVSCDFFHLLKNIFSFVSLIFIISQTLMP